MKNSRLLLALLAFMPAAFSQPDMPGRERAYAAWGEVLERHVDGQGRVDFAAMKNGAAPLERFVQWIGAAGPDTRPDLFPARNDVLAYHLNAYNALAMFNVIDEGIPERLGWLRRIRFFGLKRFKIDGKTLSLYAYENDVIRPLGEERVHFVLNCMSRGCPRLPRAPFLANDLERRLDEAARGFLNEERNVRLDRAAGTVHLSQIFEFYGDDFMQQAASLAGYVNRYRAEPIPENFEVKFIPYDWTVNRQP